MSTELERDQLIMQEAAEQERLTEQRDRKIMEEAKATEVAKPWVDPRQELVFGIGRGVAGALEEAGDGLNAVNTWINEKWDAPHIVFGDEADNGWIGVERYSEMEHPEANIFGLAETIGRTVKDAIPETETVGGQIVEEASKFAAGWYATGFLKPVQALKAGGALTTAGGYMAQGAATDFLVYDGQEERLSNFLTEFDNPLLNNAVTQYMAADGTDGELEGRMKNILEGGGLGLMADGLILGIRALRPVRRLKDFNAQRAAEKSDRAMLDEIDNTPITPLKDKDVESLFPADTVITPSRSVTETKAAPDSVFKTVTDSEGNIQVQPADARVSEGGMQLSDRGEYLQSYGIVLPTGARGLGLGQKVVLEGASAAAEMGKKLASDSEVTVAAANVYRKLAGKKGWTIRENATELVDGVYRTKNGEPMFIVDEFPGKGSLSRVDAKKVALDASVDGDAIRATVQRIVDNGDVEKLAEAVAKGDHDTILKLSGNQQHYIDWDSFADDPESLLRFVKAVEDTFEDAIKLAKGGKIAEPETIARGLKLLEQQTGGTVARSLFTDVTAQGGLSSRVFAGQQLLAEARSEMFRLAELAKSGDTEAAAQLLQHANTYAVLEAQITGSSSEIARAMRAMQIIKEQRMSSTFDFDEMLREAAMTGDVTKFAKEILENPARVSQTVADKFKVTKFDMVLEVLYGNLLSAPTTQMVNIIGNAGMTVFDYTLRAAAIIPGVARRLAGGKGSTGIAEFAGANVGIYRGLSTALRIPFRMADLAEFGKSMNWRALKGGELKEFILESENVGTMYKALLSGNAQTDIVTKLGEAGSARKAITAVLPKDIGSKSLLSQTGHWMKYLTVNTVGTVIRIPGRLIMTTDELFKAVARDTERYSKVWTEAQMVHKMTNDPRITVGDIAEEMLDIERHVKHGGTGSGNYQRAATAQQEGIDFARRQTFQSPLKGGVVMDAFGRFERFVTETKGFRLITPFVRTPTNLALQTLELTPVAQLLSKRFRDELFAGGVRQNKAMAQMALTSGAVYMLYQKFAAGELKGTGNGNNSARLDGVDRYSIKLNGHWVSFSRLDPFGAFIGFTADMIELTEQRMSPEMEAEAQSVFGGFMAAFSANFTNKTYMRGISELVEAVHYAEDGSTKSFETLVGSTLFNLMPFVGSNFERRRADGQEEFSKYIFDWKDEFISRIPKSGGLLGLVGYDGPNRSDLGTRRDPLGRPIEIKESAGPDSRLWNPIDVSSESTSQLDKALAQMDFHMSMPSRNISGVPMNGQQYSKLLYLRGQEVKVAGLTLEERLGREINRPFFQARTPDSKQDRINDIIREYGRKARKQLLREDEELDAAVDQASRQKNRVFSSTVAAAAVSEGASSISQNPIQTLMEQQAGSQEKVVQQYAQQGGTIE